MVYKTNTQKKTKHKIIFKRKEKERRGRGGGVEKGEERGGGGEGRGGEMKCYLVELNWRRKWQPTPVFLPGESQGRRGLVGCRLWGHTESDKTEAT